MVVRSQAVCDRSGVDIPGDYDGPIRFTWEGQGYEVDLCQSEADAFQAAQDDFVAAVIRIGQFVSVARAVPVTVSVSEGPNTVSIPKPKKSAPRKRASAKATTEKATTNRRPAKSSAKPFSPPAEDLVLPAEPEVATNGNAKTASKSAEVRAWAIANGYNLPPKGRMPKAVILAYEAAVGG